MRAGLADEQELRPRVPHRLADRLTREQVIAEIHRLEPRIASTVGGQPAPRRTTLAVLLVMAVLRNDELRLQGHRAVMAGANQRRGQHGVEILDAILAALAAGTGQAMYLRWSSDTRYRPARSAHDRPDDGSCPSRRAAPSWRRQRA